MSKYEALTAHLSKLPDGPVSMRFDEIDRLIGGLPRSARNHRAWWANETSPSSSHTQRRGWMGDNRKVEEVNLQAGTVRFSARD